jgi:hypothetical protein
MEVSVTSRATYAILTVIAVISAAACSRTAIQSVDRQVPAASAQCDTAVVGDFRPTEVSLASEAPVQRTIARLGLAYIAGLEYCRTHEYALPQSPDEVLAYGRTQPMLSRCALTDTSQFVDEWGINFDWVIADGSLYVVSHGPDRVRATSDDIRSPPPTGVAADTLDVADFCN